MDRDSLRRLRAQTGYLPFVSAATLARVSDEMVVPPSLYGQVFTTAAGVKVGAFALGAGLRVRSPPAWERPRR